MQIKKAIVPPTKVNSFHLNKLIKPLGSPREFETQLSGEQKKLVKFGIYSHRNSTNRAELNVKSVQPARRSPKIFHFNEPQLLNTSKDLLMQQQFKQNGSTDLYQMIQEKTLDSKKTNHSNDNKLKQQNFSQETSNTFLKKNQSPIHQHDFSSSNLENWRYQVENRLQSSILSIQNFMQDNIREFEKLINSLIQKVIEKKAKLVDEYSFYIHETLMQLSTLKSCILTSICQLQSKEFIKQSIYNFDNTLLNLQMISLEKNSRI